MNKKIFYPAILAFLAAASPIASHAQSVYIDEDPTNIRFEQYTGPLGEITFWRLPTPGASVFPGGNCKMLKIPSDKPEQSSRFMALYLFAKTSSKKIFYFYDINTCSIVSFGLNG